MYIDFKLLGKKIAQRRRELGFRQNEFAEMTNLSNNYLSNIETGRSIPSLSTFASICISLNTTPDSFLIGTIKTNNAPQDLIEKLKLCNEDSLALISDFVDLILTKYNKNES